MAKRITKLALLALCAVLLVAGSVMGTIAYLTSEKSVENTFTYGNVTIDLDEIKTDVYGTAVDPEQRVEANEYKLVPGRSYAKDTTVYVGGDSESCYVFVKLDSKFVGVCSQIKLADGWAALGGAEGVYYYNTVASADDEIEAITSFTVDSDITYEELSASQLNKASITAYAVQKDGFNDAADAWSKTFGKQS